MLKYLIHIFFLFLALQCKAQQPMYRHLTEDDGLPDNEIYYLYQDNKGMIWISTNSGLCRYNGQSFQYFSNAQLKAKSTGCIKEDAFGRIWVINFSGQIFYVQNDSLVIVNLKNAENINSLSTFTFSPQNELVVSANNQLYIYKPLHKADDERPNYVVDAEIKEANASPYYDDKGILWAYNGTLENNTTKIISYSNKAVNMFLFKKQRGLNRHQNSYVYQFSNKMYAYERESNSILEYNGVAFLVNQTLNIPGFISIEPLKDNKLAFCTNSGLYISDESKRSNKIIATFFEGQTISSFCQDNKGNYWVGTLTEGIYFIPKIGLNKVINEKIDLSKVTTICAGPANKLMLGFLNGEIGYLNEALDYRALQPANAFSTKAQTLYYNDSLQLLNWQSDKIYQSHFSALDNQINAYRGVGYSSKDFVYIPKWKAALIANPVDISITSLDKTFIETKIEKEWVSKYTVATILDKVGNLYQQSILLSNERGRAVCFDEKTETIFGADKNGITLYKKDSKINLLWNNEPIFATAFCQHDNTIWAGSFSQGLIAIKNEKAIKQFVVKDGLASNTIYRIIASKNHLWVCTDKGIQYFDIDKEKFYLIDKTIGLPSYKVNGMALVNNKLFISTPNGLLTIDDSVKFDVVENDALYLQGIYCNAVLIDSSKINFNTNENDFIFKVETPTYSNRALLRYRYRLLGADDKFTTTTLDNAVFPYKALQSGTYTFELQLIDAKGSVLGRPIYYTFNINPHFYKTTWFISLCILLISALLYVIVRNRIALIKKRGNEKLLLAKLESDLKQSQLSGIKAQMNPHFMFNALNSIQEFILLNDKKQANMYMGKFADLMRMTLDLSNKKEVLLEDEIKTLQLYLELEALRFEEHFTYNIKIDDGIDKENIHLPSMLIQPNIENAVKHGLMHKQGEKILNVHFYLINNDTLCCTITDNGIGRKRSGEINAQRLTKHTSFATGATQKRLELLNHDSKRLIEVLYEDLHDVHGNASGTMVKIIIPI